MIDLRQVFWSIRGISTYLASGFSFFKVSSVSVIAIPVAEGIIITSWLKLA